MWNTAYSRYPALVVRAHDAADVLQAVRFARREELPLSVRSGGHARPATGRWKGVMLNLSAMKGLSVDPERRVAGPSRG